MKDQTFEELAKLFPHLFEKSSLNYIECGDGWFNILYTLFGMISNQYENASRMYRYYIDEKEQESADLYAAKMEIALKEMPIMRQIKEKFGTLRIVMDGGTTEQHNWAQFAEALSGHTCDTCGSPGTARNDGWVRVMCDKHYAETVEPQTGMKRGRVLPKISDET